MLRNEVRESPSVARLFNSFSGWNSEILHIAGIGCPAGVAAGWTKHVIVIKRIPRSPSMDGMR